MNRSLNSRPARTVSPRLAAGVSAAVSMILSLHAIADDAPDATPAPEAELAEVTVVGDRLNVMQTAPVDSVFGFGKSVVDTPRSVTTISNELLSKTLITGINDLVALTPGSFTQSFFGVAGSLDVRGTPGENYFRGIKRIDNPGNYPQAIGASDRIDIVRGPASPIYGPSKIGGYLNFVPKSARASTGQFLTEPKGEVGLTYGSYDKRVIHGEVGGPTTLMGKESGYYFYGESENSGSYYENTSTQQTILQGSVDMTLSDTWRTEFGGMYQFFKGNQVAGWNRLTQDLINTGTYITGSPPALDTNHDGYISDTEATAGNIGAFIFAPSIKTPAQIVATLATHPNMALINPGTTHLSGSQVLVNEDDNLQDKVLTLYMDFIGDFGNGFTVTNKSFYESLVNNNENAYGFSQMADTYVFEDQLNFGYKMEAGSLKSAFQFGPSIRYQNFEHGDNFAFEYFDRRDISIVTKISSPVDRRGMATRGQEPYSDHVKGDFKDYGLAALADLTVFDNLSFLGGVRYDYIDMTSESLLDSITSPGLKASDTDSAFSWSGSLSYNIMGIHPYVTIAKQSTMILGQGGQLDPSNIVAKTAVADSKLNEFGVKGSLLEGKLFVAVDYYKQERIDYNAQDTVTNNTTQAKGYEAEVRFVVNPLLTLTGGYTNIKVFNLTAAKNGTQFSFAGAGDLKGVNPALIYGGVVPSIVLVSDGARKAGIPENIWSLNAMISADPWVQGLSGTISLQSVDSTPSGFSKTVILPGYTLVNLGLHYEDGPWSTGLQVKNATDARYFRSNFPDLFGSSVVLPEVPRTYTVTASYKF
jgi:iron complex outermembrane receptor protein